MQTPPKAPAAHAPEAGPAKAEGKPE
jgi:hypothetical protein